MNNTSTTVYYYIYCVCVCVAWHSCAAWHSRYAMQKLSMRAHNTKSENVTAILDVHY
jgi:hypothetical protein